MKEAPLTEVGLSESKRPFLPPVPEAAIDLPARRCDPASSQQGLRRAVLVAKGRAAKTPGVTERCAEDGLQPWGRLPWGRLWPPYPPNFWLNGAVTVPAGDPAREP